MLTIVFDLDGTLIDTAPDLIDTLNLILGARGPARGPLRGRAAADRRRRARHDRAGAGRRMAATARPPISTGCSTTSSTIMPSTSPTARARSRARSDARPPGRRGPSARGLHQQARMAFGAAARHAALADRFAAICGQDTFGVQKPDPRSIARDLFARRRRADPGYHGRGFRHRHPHRPRRRHAGHRGRFRLQRGADRDAWSRTGSSAPSPTCRRPSTTSSRSGHHGFIGKRLWTIRALSALSMII